ncbi:MAG: HAMP domain-containing histidine kinase [Ruminococcus sp.]|nr:HAMP domain-containing histidine kinase [Ruminococcus sp.]
MKSKIRRKKRVTFIRLFASFSAIAVFLSLIFANLFHEILIREIRSEISREIMYKMSQIQSKVSEFNETSRNPIKQLDAFMTVYTFYSVATGYYIVNSGFDENCYAVSALIDDETDTVIASNKQKLITFLKLRDGERFFMYSCDRELFNIPELDELFDNYSGYSYEISFNSIYVNEDDYSFVPHDVTVEKLQDSDDALKLVEIAETKKIVIDFDNENYELVNLTEKSEKKAPHTFLDSFQGYDNFDYTALTDSRLETSNFPFADSTSAGWFYNNNLLDVHATNKVYIDGKTYTLRMLFVLDENCKPISEFYWKYTIIFSLTALVLAFILSLAQHIINKTRYAFEDYQKALINNLSHDLKTPMTAIGGYAENAKKQLENGKSEDIASFLDAITENVFYIDNIINRTLELNHLNKIQEVKKELVELHKIAETSVEKYNLILDEKNITVELNGRCELMADRTTIESAIENLISNAVKYTAENGRILITADKNSLTVTNDTTDTIDTKDLIMPFVKGDKSRNENSSGIGLSIVQSVADLNHLKFKISSSENQFKAVLSK